MSHPSSAPVCFEIKSANLPLLAFWLKVADLERLRAELAQHLGHNPGFFDDDPLVLDLTPLVSQPDLTLDFVALKALLKTHRLHAVAVRGGSEAQRAAAQAAGLFQADDLESHPAMHPASPVPTPAAAVAPAPPGCAMVVDRPLRSGQQVYARGRDLVVMAMVNPGAEVIADGHVHVYAPLRGKAIAGARGDGDARIIALSMDPELLSIAGIYRTSEVPLPPEVMGRPAQVRLQTGPDGQERLRIDPLSS